MVAPKTLGDEIVSLYESRTEEDFAHMERMLADHAGQPRSAGSDLAELLLNLRAMERAEQET
jgi:hypothetical protein